jgi:anti-sigma B factor antagonist
MGRDVTQAVAGHAITDGGSVTIELAGELDIATAEQLRAALEAACRDARIVHVDATRVTLLDSTSLGVLLYFARELRDRGGYLELSFATPAVKRALHLASLGRALRLADRADGEDADDR